MRRALVLSVALVLASLVACYTGPSLDLDTSSHPLGAGDAASPEASGLPCELAQMLVARCGACHDRPDNTVLTFDALSGPAYSDKGQSLAALAVARMRDARQPMPPSGLLPEAEIALLDGWRQQGMPRGTCAGPLADAGSVGDATVDLTGLPCDLATLLVDHCARCHTEPGRTPLTYDALTGPSAADPSKTVAVIALERMKDAKRPMPPSGLLSASATAILEGWLQRGAPRGSCAVPVGDAGADASVDASVDMTGFPCDVSGLIGASCAGCHVRAGNTPLTYASLTGPWSTDPTRTLASIALVRMQDAVNPMPPSGVLGAASAAVLGGWIAGGMPHGACDPGADAGPDPFAGPAVCSSATYWTRGDQESSLMHPGRACARCHGTAQLAGTVYATGHEPDDCNGISGGATVVITDAVGTARSLKVNAAGNFLRSMSGVVLPYTAKVVAGGRERAMITPQTNGDCNACHAQFGTPAPKGAPGRVMSP